MQARLSKWEELTKNAQPATFEELNKWAKESNKQIYEKKRIEAINQYLEKIPLRFRNKNFADFQVENNGQSKVKNIMMRYVNTFQERSKVGTPVIFRGNPGTGKTLLSQIIQQRLILTGFKIKYEPSLEFIKKLLEIKFKSQDHFDANLYSLKNIQLLIIDEVTESITKDGKPSEIEKQVLFKIINDRYENNLCTLVISNRSREEMIDRLSIPICERLNEKGISLAFDWDSYRYK